jgi:hypothetical protein
MNRSSPALVRRVTSLAALTVSLLALPPATFGKGGPTVTVDGEVDVAEPVEIHGVVETLNDLLHQPYMVRGSDSLDSGAAPDSLVVDFDIPDGKRLIVETVTFQARAANGEESRLFLEPQTPQGNRLLTYLSVQSIIDGYMVSTLPVKLRIDAIEGSTSEVRIRLGNTPGPASLGASLFGYLVDL